MLNLGHTFAHGIEAASQHGVTHGEAVAVGLSAACLLADRLGLAEPSLAARVDSLLAALGLHPRVHGLDVGAVWQAMAVDKKRAGGRLRFVLPVAAGRVVAADDVPEEAALAVLREVLSSPLRRSAPRRG